VSLARLERLPWLRLTALPRVSFQPVIDRTELTVGVELFFPVWNWNLGKIATEEARLLRDGDQYVAEMAQLRKDVAMALEQVASRRALLALYEADLLPALEARVAGVKQAVQGAQADRTALFIAQDALLNAQRTTVRARRDLRLSQIELDRALGGGTAGATP
jgi:outer membrane protein TolC